MNDILQRLRLLVPSDSSGAAIEAADTITRLTARVEELEGALTRMIDLCTVGANPGAFDNGNLDSTGIDEGDFIAGRIIDDARAAITQETRDE